MIAPLKKYFFLLTHFYLVALFFVILPCTAHAQQNHKSETYSFANKETRNIIRPLGIGERLPGDLIIGNVFNYPSAALRLSDLKGKLILLDFWSTWCSSCIEGFPKLHALKKEFGDDLQVILVNTYYGDNANKVKAYFEKRKQRTGQTVTLPYVLQDSLLAAYFPHRVIPHYAWLNEKGVVLAVTSAKEVTAQNIGDIIAGKNIALHQKKDVLDFDIDKPLLIDGNGGEGITVRYRSMFTGYIEGVGNFMGIRRDSANQIVGYYSFNKPLLDLYAEAFREKMIYPANRIFVETKNKSAFTTNANSPGHENIFTYELISPPIAFEQVMMDMQEGLKRTFHADVRVEKRKIKCLALSASSHISKAYTKGGETRAEFEKSFETKYLQNYPMIDLLWLLNTWFPIPVIDETKLTQNIDMPLPKDLTDKKALIQALKKVGFIVQETEREMEVAVLIDDNCS